MFVNRKLDLVFSIDASTNSLICNRNKESNLKMQFFTNQNLNDLIAQVRRGSFVVIQPKLLSLLLLFAAATLLLAGSALTGRSVAAESSSAATPAPPSPVLPAAAPAPMPNAVATIYKHCNFDSSGYAVSLAPGTYTLAQLQAAGIANNDISSLKVTSGYEVVLYADDNFAGASWTYRTDQTCLVNTGNNDVVSSLKIQAINTTPSWSKCADENQFCSFSGTRQVRYGANGVYVTKTFTDGTACTNAVFGDPVVGVYKSCEVSTEATNQTQDLPGPTMNLSAPAGRVVNVSSVDQLANAMSNASAGDVITINPGTYYLNYKIATYRSGTSAQPIYVRAARLGDVEIRAETEEVFLIIGSYWRFENLKVTGVCADHYTCNQIFHISGPQQDIVIRNNRLLDYNAPYKTNADLFGDPNRKYPHDILIEHNLMQHTVPRLPSQYRSVNGVNIDGGYNFTVRANVMLDIAKGDADAEAGFMKANGRDGIFERNLVVCRKYTTAGDRVGLSFGGGGAHKDIYDFNPDQRGMTPEWNYGIARNNVTIGCDNGFYNNKGWQTKLYNNTFYNSWNVDSRFAASHLIATNNVIQGTIRLRDGGTAENNNNVFFNSAADFTQYFQDPANILFSLKSGTNPIRGTAIVLPEVTNDICGVARGSSNRDLGAFNSSTNPGCAAAIQAVYQSY